MPVYNAGNYLRASIESILGQSQGDFEFLIFNDASTDNSLDIIKSYNDSRIKIIDSPVNTGYLKHLNHGLQLARGKYIARMDADDISLPQRFEEQVKYLRQNPSVKIVGSYITVFAEQAGDIKIIKYPTLPGKIKWHAIKGTPLAHPAVMLDKKCLLQLEEFYKEEYYPSEDYEFWTRLLEKCNIGNIPQPLLKYRSHEMQTSSVKAELQKKNAMRIKKHYIRSLFNIRSEKLAEEIYLLFNNPSLLKFAQFYCVAAFITGKALLTRGIDKKSLLLYIQKAAKTKVARVIKKHKAPAAQVL
ncbi:MAG TPA: glycosyltransferase [Chitinophagaceae bacterium]|nr:glycosyltransferase [Chitinophagaceae bacterium]